MAAVGPLFFFQKLFRQMDVGDTPLCLTLRLHQIIATQMPCNAFAKGHCMQPIMCYPCYTIGHYFVFCIKILLPKTEASFQVFAGTKVPKYLGYFSWYFVHDGNGKREIMNTRVEMGNK